MTDHLTAVLLFCSKRANTSARCCSGMDQLREFEKEQNQNWLKGAVGLLCLRKLLECFIDEEIGSFHQKLINECGERPCEKSCNIQQNQSHPLCEVCSSWRASILANHTSGKLMWVNSKPDQWYQDKWEVAKVYMPNGHKDHHSIGDFDIASKLRLINQCKHFKKFKLGAVCDKVSEVRNKIMHAPRYQLEQEDLIEYFKRIREFGEVLGKHRPEFKSLSKDIDEIQNRDCRLIFPDDMEAQKTQIQTEKQLEDILFAVAQVAAEQYRTRMMLEKLERQTAQPEQEKKPLAGAGSSTTMSRADKAKFVDDNKATLIQHVTVVMAITEELGDMVHPEAYSLIDAKITSHAKMRELYDNPLRSGGEEVKAAFYDALKKHHSKLV